MSLNKLLLNESFLSKYQERGLITLYHFSQNNEEEFQTDPNLFGKYSSWTRGDIKASDLPRTFFYLNLNDVEYRYRSKAYSGFEAEVLASSIYNLYDDPLYYREKNRKKNNGVLNIDELLRTIKNDFKGVAYRTGGMDIVNYFYPLDLTKIQTAEEEEKQAHEYQKIN